MSDQLEKIQEESKTSYSSVESQQVAEGNQIQLSAVFEQQEQKQVDTSSFNFSQKSDRSNDVEEKEKQILDLKQNLSQKDQLIEQMRLEMSKQTEEMRLGMQKQTEELIKQLKEKHGDQL
ncbi:hypothetical protein ABPG72_001689 [Tetrahymena utriculariae]